MRFFAMLLVAVLSSVPSVARAQETAENKAAALATLARNALRVIGQHYVLDGAAITAKAGKSLPGTGKWSIGKQAPKGCPTATDTCVSVFYTVPEADVVCEWTVLLIGDGSTGRVLDENDDAARYLVVRTNQSDATDIVVARKEPIYPAIAQAAHMEGDVEMRITVSADGAVERAISLGGPEMLVGVAIDAVKQWRFKPVLVGNRAVRFQTNVTMSFRTNGPHSSKVWMKP